MELFRPTGLAELRLVIAARWRAWPPRLPDQPIFYPVLERDYATQIARDWNAPSPEGAGYVTRFEVDDDVAARYEPRQVGARSHRELWVPAEELAAFNAALRGPIELVAGHFEDHFQGIVPTSGPLAGMDAKAQRAHLEPMSPAERGAILARCEEELVVCHRHWWPWPVA